MTEPTRKMKRTEAIEWLEVMKEDAIFEQYDALKMAIEALQITETPIDLVSRADVVREFIKLFCCIKDVSDIEEWKDICQTTIREVPSAKTPNNTQTIDLINRADAIELCAEAQGRASTKAELKGISKVWQGLLKLPSAKPTSELISREETPTNAPTDLISRADALKPFCIAPDGTRIPEVDCDNLPVEFSVEFIKKHLLSLPPTDVVSREEYVRVLIECGEVKTKLGELQQTIKANQGEWIKTVDGNGWDDWYVLKCPFCGAIIEDKHYHSWEYNFCPHCGADVRGERSE